MCTPKKKGMVSSCMDEKNTGSMSYLSGTYRSTATVWEQLKIAQRLWQGSSSKIWDSLQDDLLGYCQLWGCANGGILLERFLFHPQEEVKQHMYELIRDYKRLYGLHLEEVLNCVVKLYKLYRLEKENTLEEPTLQSLELKYKVFEHVSERKLFLNKKKRSTETYTLVNEHTF